MKICYFSVFPLEYGGGFEKYLIETAVYLKENFDEIEDVCIINFTNESYKKICRFISLSWFYKISPIYREGTRKISDELKKVGWIKISSKGLEEKLNQYDIIYTKNELLELSILKRVKLNRNIKLIAGVHTAFMYPVVKSFASRFHNFIYNSLLYRWLAKRVDAFHVLNQYNFDLLKKRFPRKTIKKIYNPFDFEEFERELEKNKYQFNWDRTKYNIIWVGRMEEQKGVDDLVKIITKLNETKHGEKIIWNLVGDGEERQKTLGLRERYKNINCFGYVENIYLPSILRENNLLIFTSHGENFPYTILEAMCLDKPVIAYNISGVNDIVENGENGILVKNINGFMEEIKNFVDGKRKFSGIKDNIKTKFNQKNLYKELFAFLKE